MLVVNQLLKKNLAQEENPNGRILAVFIGLTKDVDYEYKNLLRGIKNTIFGGEGLIFMPD